MSPCTRRPSNGCAARFSTAERMAAGQAFCPGVHVIRAIHLAGPLDLLVGRQRFLDEAAHLLLVVGMPLHRFEDEVVGRASGLLRERVDARA
jgi:hypothetical protein